MFAKNEEVIVKMRLARRKIPVGQARGWRENFNGSIGTISTRNDFVIVGHNSSNRAVNDYAASDGDAQLCNPNKSLLGHTLGDVENIAGLQANVFGLKLHDFAQVDFHFVLLAVSIVADDDCSIGLRGTVEATSKRKHLEGSELPAIIGNNKAAWPGNCAERVHDAGVGHTSRRCRRADYWQ